MNPIGRHLWVVLTAFVLLSKLLFVLKITIVISSFRGWELSSQNSASYRDLRSCRCGSIWPCEDSSRGVSIPSILQGRSESENGIQEVKVNRWLIIVEVKPSNLPWGQLPWETVQRKVLVEWPAPTIEQQSSTYRPTWRWFLCLSSEELLGLSTEDCSNDPCPGRRTWRPPC